MKIKDIFKGAATAAIAFGASKLLPEPIAKPVGTAISKALFSPSGGGSGPNGQISKQDMEKLIEKATQAAPAQTIRIEQAPIAITPVAPTQKPTENV